MMYWSKDTQIKSRELIRAQVAKLESQIREMSPNTDPLFENLAATLKEMDGALQEMEEIKKIISSHIDP